MCQRDLPVERRYRPPICVKLIYTYVRLINRHLYSEKPKICLHSCGNSAVFSANSGSNGISRTLPKMSALVVWAISGSLEGLFKTTPRSASPPPEHCRLSGECDSGNPSGSEPQPAPGGQSQRPDLCQSK